MIFSITRTRIGTFTLGIRFSALWQLGRLWGKASNSGGINEHNEESPNSFGAVFRANRTGVSLMRGGARGLDRLEEATDLEDVRPPETDLLVFPVQYLAVERENSRRELAIRVCNAFSLDSTMIVNQAKIRSVGSKGSWAFEREIKRNGQGETR